MWWCEVHCGKMEFDWSNTVVHFTVVCLVAKPLNRSEAKGDLVMIQTLLLFKCKLLCYHANWILVSITTGSPSASLQIKGLATKCTTVKLPIQRTGLTWRPGFRNLKKEGSEMRDCYYEQDTGIGNFEGRDSGISHLNEPRIGKSVDANLLSSEKPSLPRSRFQRIAFHF